MHSVYALLKIFRVKPQDPLLWQDSYLDEEINKILDQRDRAITYDLNRYQVYAHGGVRKAAQKVMLEQAKKDKEAAANHADLAEKMGPRRKGWLWRRMSNAVCALISWKSSTTSRTALMAAARTCIRNVWSGGCAQRFKIIRL